MADEKKNTDEVSGRSLYDLILTILRDRKLLMIAIPLVVVGLVVYWFILHPPSPGPNPSTTTTTTPVNRCSSWTLTGRLISDSDEFLNLTGVTVGVESGPYSFDDRIVNGDFRISGYVFPNDSFVDLYLQRNSHSKLFYRSPFDASRMRLNSNSCVLLFQQDLVVSHDVLHEITPASNPQPIHTAVATTFSLNIDDEAVRREIARITKLTYDPNSSRNKVFVTFDTTKITSIGPSTYNFESSSAIVQIDNRKYKLKDCVIPAPAFPSHDRQVIKDEVGDLAVSAVIPYLRSHPNQIARWITGP